MRVQVWSQILNSIRDSKTVEEHPLCLDTVSLPAQTSSTVVCLSIRLILDAITFHSCHSNQLNNIEPIIAAAVPHTSSLSLCIQQYNLTSDSHDMTLLRMCLQVSASSGLKVSLCVRPVCLVTCMVLVLQLLILTDRNIYCASCQRNYECVCVCVCVCVYVCMCVTGLYMVNQRRNLCHSVTANSSFHMKRRCVQKETPLLPVFTVISFPRVLSVCLPVVCVCVCVCVCV